ncbi:hypothetical protein [Corynebacterium sp.]|uniref:hypothetical protein n=1 Tax=Corynebacterium sp. TaxID=1720 RepID=UPI0026DD391E|nr:hypothetical protein [Corynebacterium sp.]MDO5032119.1 hypothetical protein [Corynebacterium sp.]
MKKIASAVLVGITALSLTQVPTASALNLEPLGDAGYNGKPSRCNVAISDEEIAEFEANARTVYPNFATSKFGDDNRLTFDINALSLFGRDEVSDLGFSRPLEGDTTQKIQDRVNRILHRDDALHRGETVDDVKVTNAVQHIVWDIDDFYHVFEPSLSEVPKRTAPGTLEDVYEFNKLYVHIAEEYSKQFEPDILADAVDRAGIYAMGKLKFDHYEQWREQFASCITAIDPAVKIPPLAGTEPETEPEAPLMPEVPPAPEMPEASTPEGSTPDTSTSESSAPETSAPETSSSQAPAPKPPMPKPPVVTTSSKAPKPKPKVTTSAAPKPKPPVVTTSSKAPKPQPKVTTSAQAPKPQPKVTTSSQAPKPKPPVATTSSKAPKPQPKVTTSAQAPKPKPKVTTSAAPKPKVTTSSQAPKPPVATTSSKAPKPQPKVTTSAQAPKPKPPVVTTSSKAPKPQPKTSTSATPAPKPKPNDSGSSKTALGIGIPVGIITALIAAIAAFAPILMPQMRAFLPR